MADSFKLDFLSKILTLLQSAINKKKSFPNELCNLLTYEFNLSAAAIISIEENDKLSVFAKSASVDDSKLKDVSLSDELKKQIEKNTFELKTGDSNYFKISDDNLIEASFLITTSFNIDYIFIAAAESIDENDKSSKGKFKLITDLIGISLHNYFVKLQALDSTSAGESNFSKIVRDTTLQLYSPLKNVVDKAKVLSGEYLSTYQLNFVAEINSGSKFALSTIKELSEYADYESDEIKLQNQKIVFKDFVNEFVNNFNFENPAKPETLKVEIDDSVSNHLDIDAEKFKSILYNLCKLVKVISINKNIFIKISEQNKKLLFTIDSPGKGFKQFEDRLILHPFDVNNKDFYKEADITPLEMQNTLNGIELLSGDISVNRSDTGKSNFLLSISLDETTEININNKTDEAEMKESDSRNKVLVIEDDFATADMMRRYLEKWGYQPLIVNSSEETLKAVKEHSFMVIILDTELPENNSLELLKNIHANPKNKFTPVIVCSVEPENQKALMIGSVDFFEKPINYGFLVEALAHYKLNKNSKILCVDDDLPTLNLIKKSVESAGFICIAESDSSKVMNLIKDEDLDLAIIDLDMPDPNGYELIKLIKMNDKFKNLPIIIFTGKDDYKEELKNVNGLFEYLLEKKSTKIDQLIEHINGVITRLESPPTIEEVVSKEDDEIKILLAEDYKHSQIIVTRLLKKNNFENVVVVENGLEAYNLAQKEKFDIILMDMQMPIMNGFEATAKIRELTEYKDTPIIALTAFAMKGDKEKCLDAGASDYIPKPIDSKEFIKKIKQYTEAS
ncbi:MAG: response regulator [Ignavibacteriae bacterium]|nr:response regulator [Ignavibacteriota bacterium]NOG98735.1 response regulator [Ignavibacteriota bacterium]